MVDQSHGSPQDQAMQENSDQSPLCFSQLLADGPQNGHAHWEDEMAVK